MKLLGKSSFGYQVMERSRHTDTKYLNCEKTHKAINGKMFSQCVEKNLQNPKMSIENL